MLREASVCVTTLYGTNKVKFICACFVSKPKQGSDKVDVLSEVEKKKECKMGVGWCCLKGVLWVLRLALGPGYALWHWTSHFFLWSWLGGKERGYFVPRTVLEMWLRLSPFDLDFLFFERKKHWLRECVNCSEFPSRKLFALLGLK